MKIQFRDIHKGMQFLLDEHKLLFGQDFIHVRGKSIDGAQRVSGTGVEEKINAFLEWLPHYQTVDVPDAAPTAVPIKAVGNGKSVIQEGHHSALAFAIMHVKGNYRGGLCAEQESFGANIKPVDKVFIFEGSNCYLSVLKDDRWELFDGPVPAPVRQGRDDICLKTYKRNLSSHYAELGAFLG